MRVVSEALPLPNLTAYSRNPQPTDAVDTAVSVRRLFVGLAIALAVGACSNAAATSTPPVSTTGPVPTPTPSASAAPSGVGSAAQAAALVLASDPHFASVRPGDPNLIGQCCTYEAVDAAPGYQVTVNLGWGDCPAGCISHHQSTFHVDPDGTITIVGQSGDENPPTPSGEGVTATVTLHLRAGPTCPVAQESPDPACEPRKVANAEVVLKSPDGNELGRATSNADGQVELRTPRGAYYVESQPVDGLLGTAPAFAFSVVAGETVDINVDYDTGIR
jgi:hypothetical protein